jgi:hypothetical protein
MLSYAYLANHIKTTTTTNFMTSRPQANYTNRGIAVCPRIYYQLLCLEGFRVVRAKSSHWRLSLVSRPKPLFSHSNSCTILLTKLSGPRSRTTTSLKIKLLRESNTGPLDL